MAPRRLGLMKKVCIFAFVIIPLYTVFYIMYFQKANLLLKNGLNCDETKGLQYNLDQDNTQEVLRGREDTKRLSSDNARQDSSFSHFEKTQSNSKVHFKINDSRSIKTEIPIKETAISKNILPTSVTTKELARRQVKEQLVTSITPTQATKVKLAPNKQRMIWNEDSSSSNLNRRLQTVKNNYVAMNKYAVNFTGSRRSRKLSSKELLCELKQRVEVASIQLGDEPFTTSKWQEYLPNRNFSQVLGHFRTCAVVASAGSILQSRLGSEIDAHDAVLRFNGAPTTGFESDVGSRTTIRIVNSQVLSRPEHKFHVNSLYKTGVLLVWDPAPYSGNLTEWFKHPDYDFFENYIKYREKNPNQPFYIINPKMQWQLWNIIQENTAEDIQRNPPSSGLMDVYEFLPSRRRTDLCHYYERFQDQACTMGAYHPLMFEKNLVKRINRGSDREIYVQGKATLPGFGTFQCPNPE
ncbi:beta-galactoside alpha-2,6-sialyltransferase 1-like isoform X2 [Pristis pectinata]|uniref:beta-galactoside alpha-2,6-sialyltransferase 1-like isoform X2 n=1 Tax=Pristis pectinata TaxID=685728 RepID=UPI00223C97C4|nr:beta-galactoside alpha-2,6-sialyltransferase 1-like isoform X2 [Pristis pectinata]